MTACAGGYGDYGGGYASNGYVDGYYDNFYGPFDTGYWGGHGVFMYRGGDQDFHRHDSGHFRRDTADSFHAFHAHAAHPGGRRQARPG